ncbi:MAG: prepilin-type N-terminal cleavage/methylation domain-containing protein [Elusimicrobiota bacterium]|jgi:prepilin-type N-terminal cleavage/methylation domain-containing protein
MVKRNNGVTLTELLMVLAILGSIALLSPPMLRQATNFFILGRARLELQREARGAMYIITRELRQAQSSTITITQSSGQPYYSQISFTNAQGKSVTVAQSGSNLTLTLGTTVSTLTRNLAYLAFTFPSSDDMTIVSVSMTLQQQIYGGAIKALHMASEKIRVMN